MLIASRFKTLSTVYLQNWNLKLPPILVYLHDSLVGTQLDSLPQNNVHCFLKYMSLGNLCSLISLLQDTTLHCFMVLISCLSEKLANAHCTLTVCTVYTRVSQYVTNFRFYNVFIIRQAHFFPKTRNKQICAYSCKICKQKFSNVRIFNHCTMTKILKKES